MRLALDRLARSDDVRHVAVMPDVHLARDVCIGTVLATSHLVYPAAVGGDIGCGVAALAFDREADVLRDASRAERVLEMLYESVPVIRHRRAAAPDLPPALAESPLSDGRLSALLRRDGRVQFGTLGRGNHFLEFQSDDEGRLWLMVHSGSRAVGQAVRDLHLAGGRKSASGLSFLDADEPGGRAYLADMERARNYARGNRRAMAASAAWVAATVLGASPVDDTYFDCDHNHVRREAHLGREGWVHRKGAVSAAAGEPGIIPGSMGTESYHVEGRGDEQSLRSSSHGAGRAMSRDEARRHVSVRELHREMKGVWFDPRAASQLRDEAPSAYKDVRAVLRAQRDLTRVVRRLRLCLKT